MLDFLRRRFPETVDVRLDGRPITVTVRVSERARSYRLSLPHSGAPVLTVPRHGRWPEAAAFLDRQTPWLAARIGRAPRPVPFAEGHAIPLRGLPHRIAATGRVRGHVVVEHGEAGPVLHVPGAPEHLPRRLTDWLKQQAGRDLQAAVAVHAGRLEVAVSGIGLRDQSTRWGSCSSSGRLNFNWRLILAPPSVLDYVAAHEVAHRVHMNHSDAFWQTVKRTCPGMAAGRAWLKAHGGELMAYGRG